MIHVFFSKRHTSIVPCNSSLSNLLFLLNLPLHGVSSYTFIAPADPWVGLEFRLQVQSITVALVQTLYYFKVH
uniref:Putative ovule protein n=1 Tax=Solanum chacoense TaxID=4108 RepID=A0A0V0GRJ1_SOLCH